MIETLKPLAKPLSVGGIALGSLFSAFSLTATGAQAQQVGPSWVKVCTKVSENDICNVKYEIITNTRQLITAVNLIQSKGTINRRFFQVAVPSGRNIPQGIKMQIDAGKVNTLPYSICLPDRCLAELPLSQALVKALKAGGEITLTSTNFRQQKNPVKVSLNGFTAAFDGPPLKRDEVENRNKALEDALKKKTKAAADKLRAAQEAAKNAGN